MPARVDPPPRRGLRALWSLAARWPGPLAAVIGLGILSSLFEGIGLSLFIPLLHSFADAPLPVGGDLVGRLAALGQGIPEDWRMPAIVLAIFGCICLKSLLQYAGSTAASWLAGQAGHRLRSQLFHRFLGMSQACFEGQRSSTLMNGLATETWSATRALSVLLAAIANVCTILLFVALLLAINWRATLVVAGALGGIALLVHLVTRRARRLSAAGVAANKAFADRMWEALGGMRVIRAFGQEEREAERFAAASERVRHSFFRMERMTALASPLFESLSALLVLGMLAALLVQDRGALPSMAAFALILYRLQPQVRQLIAHRTALSTLAGPVAEVFGLLHPAERDVIRGGTGVPGPLTRGVAFDRVTFGYGEGEPALREASFTIPAGKVTAVVGPSGAGKSTVAGLLCRFFDPQDGTILVDGTPLPALDLRAWRRRIGVVAQDVVLFSGTVHDNIAYGRPDATRAEVEQAARMAQADGFIAALPQGFDTPLGDRAMRLSGGQRQRIALARAMLCQPDVLLLDEATAALDSRAEHLVREALETFRQGRTVLVITHRLDSLALADHIVVLDQGRVVEQGAYATLLARRGLFAQLHAYQERPAQAAGARQTAG
ncbi:ABC transporter ATP-binding protein [Aerophototrophica crusticola]|uniref:ABC transporter ATP-binding protein n=1 Tax=Aerophototrophica crusticola TaxID=1709002 RepID=A0A858R7U2_9PROT|nr:ABC transporter ATP-binding protein [Rhodospirillaceae bacterium B3]